MYWYFAYGKVYHILSGKYHKIKCTGNQYPIMLCGRKSWHHDLHEHAVGEAPTFMPLCKLCERKRDQKHPHEIHGGDG